MNNGNGRKTWQLSKHIALWLVSLATLTSAMGSAWANPLVLDAREAYRTNDQAALIAYADSLKKDALGAYPHYWLVSRQIEQQNEAGVAAFLSENEGTYLAERLRGEWLRAVGKRGDWATFRRELPKLRDIGATDLKCYNYSARFDAGDKRALDEARQELWLTAKDMPPACDALFQALIDNRAILESDFWDRIQLALESNAQGLVRHLSRSLNQEISAATLSGIVANPAKYLENPPMSTRLDRELVVFAISRQARVDLDKALAQVERYETALGREAKYAWRILGVAGARNLNDRALNWFERSGDYPYTDTQREWRVRAGLRAGNWRDVLNQIQSMSASYRQITTWRYWEARALAATNKSAEANRIFANLAANDDYYGLLSRERLGQMLTVPEKNYQVSNQDWRRVAENASLQRAVLLYEMDLKAEASREFNWGLRGADDPLLLAAAEQANAIGWYDRSVAAAERTKSLHNYSLRYPTPFRGAVRKYSQEVGLDEAWVYGLMRQESRFVTNARSVVGASGLMQLMPATADWVGKRVGVRYTPAALTNPDTNIQFGTYYLKHVQDRLSGSALLATAGYNAGPNRGRNWQAEIPLEAAIYVDTAPFLETREYMRKVMANAYIYGRLLQNNKQTLSERMGVVAARNPQVIEGP